MWDRGNTFPLCAPIKLVWLHHPPLERSGWGRTFVQTTLQWWGEWVRASSWDPQMWTWPGREGVVEGRVIRHPANNSSQLVLAPYVSVAPQKQSSKRFTGPLLFERNYCGLVMIKEVITLPAITESPCSNLVVANSLSWERRKINKFAQVRKNKLHVCKIIQTESSKCLISYPFSNFVTPTRIFRRQDLACACLALQKLPAQTGYLTL